MAQLPAVCDKLRAALTTSRSLPTYLSHLSLGRTRCQVLTAIVLIDIVPVASYSSSYLSGHIAQLPTVSDTLRAAITTSRCVLTYSSRLTRQLPTVDTRRAVVSTLRTAYAGGFFFV